MNALLTLLVGAVARAMDTDDVVGANVSGGIDSSTVTVLARRINPDLPTFTGYYDEPGFSELEYARLVGGKNHHEILITPRDFVEHFDDMVAAFEPPFQGMGMFGQYMVARYIAENTDVQVVLSGEGSDELFGGYARLIAVAGEKLPDGYEDYIVPDGYPTNLANALDYDYERLPDLLAVDDAALGAFGLEARAPFTDPRVAAHGLNLPSTLRVAKRHLKGAVRGVVPDAILDRTDKMGMPAPLVKWTNEDPVVREFVTDRIGYVPDPGKPWDRGWWIELLEATHGPVSIAA